RLPFVCRTPASDKLQHSRLILRCYAFSDKVGVALAARPLGDLVAVAPSRKPVFGPHAAIGGPAPELDGVIHRACEDRRGRRLRFVVTGKLKQALRSRTVVSRERLD